MILDIIDDLVGIFNREDIDLIILNNADVELQVQVIKYGKVIYMKDLFTKVVYESNIMSRYMDMEHFRNVQNEVIHFWQVYNRKWQGMKILTI